MIRLKRILVPTDFSEFADQAMHFACDIACRFDSEVTLLNVIQNPLTLYPEERALFNVEEYESDLKQAAESQLEKLPGDESFKHINIVRLVRTGTPFLEIIRFAKSNSTDLIVMGTHGRTGVAHLLIGSVAEKVVRKAPCPVLTVRNQDHEFVMP